jgi:hypothetical protein
VTNSKTTRRVMNVIIFLFRLRLLICK